VSQQKTITFAVRGPVARSDLPGLCDRLSDLIAKRNATCAVCDVGDLAPDAVAVDALARLRLVGRQRGCAVRLQRCSDELRDVVSFVGLQRILLS
jgi:ABC-type transporter Mla MlaB component